MCNVGGRPGPGLRSTDLGELFNDLQMKTPT